MKLATKRSDLSSALTMVERAVPTRTPLPVLSNFMLETDDGRLRLTANNLEQSITRWIDAEVAEEGSVLLPARLFADFVSSLDGVGVVELSRNGAKQAHVTYGHASANIAGTDIDDFPKPPQIDVGDRFTLRSAVLKRLIKETAFAAAHDETRPMLSGVLLKLQGTGLTLAAADGFRLAFQTATVDIAEGADALSVIVPAQSMRDVGAILPDSDEPVEIVVTPGGNQILFRLADAQLVSRVIFGQFPDYERIIPRGFDTRVTISGDAFLRATKVAAAFSRTNSNIVRLAMQPGEPSQLVVSAQSQEQGDGTTEVECAVEGPALDIVVNVRYLAEAIEALGDGPLALQATTPTMPMLLLTSEGGGGQHVVMPMHADK